MKVEPTTKQLIAMLYERIPEMFNHYTNTSNPVDFPKLGCVNHDCDKCKAKEAMADQSDNIPSSEGYWKWSYSHWIAKHQEELNKFAEDSVWDGEGS